MTAGKDSPWPNALIGAIVTIVLSFTLISPILGGALAGYLERANGIRIGAFAGGIAALPVLLLALVLGFNQISGGGLSGFEITLSFTVLFVVPIYIIGLSTLGGILGVSLQKRLEENE